MRILLTFLLISLCLGAFATHNRGGEITYRHIGGNTYEFTITTCTKSSAPADRPELSINWDDGTSNDTVGRSQIIALSNDAQKNIYVATHTFAGAGSFRVTVEDPNRNGGVTNISGGNSDQQTFCIASEIVISPFLGVNNSVQFADCPCPEFACANTKYCYNPQAFDVDGDSLSYKLVPCLGVGCNSMVIPLVYQYPDAFGGTIAIDQSAGTLCWDAPQIIGEYNIALIIEEWRNGIKIGSVLRDIQITVIPNCNNDPPVIAEIADTCIVAGDAISFNVTATDPNLSDVITLVGTGAPFSLAQSPATFPAASGNSPVTGNFNWQTSCDNIRQAPYEVYFTATDNGSPVQLSDFKRVNITVKAPAPTGLTATPFSGSVDLNWDPSSCDNAQGYRIYRKKGNGVIDANCCNQTSPVDLGYTLIGSTTNVNDTAYLDTDQLAIGEEYCYVITAVFPINVESCISTEACTKLIKDVPVITHVTVNTTDIVNGIDSIMWSKPTELDTLVNFPPPYLYKVYQGAGFSSANNLIFTSPAYTQLYLSDTIYTHNNVNTSTTPNAYRVEMYHIAASDTLLIGGTNTASSIFLSLTPNDNQIGLSWNEVVPWTNTSYEVFKGTAIGGVFNLIGTTTNTTYTDSNLINGQTYCYKIKSTGNYTDPSIINPIINFSQEACASPIDLTPPCPPVLTIDDSCDVETNLLSWTNPNNSCADDVTRYRIYFSPTEGGSFTLIQEINLATDTSYEDLVNLNKAGCYYVTALDSIQYNNESAPSNIVCVDNCPIYFLPNVFSPNGDGANDFFTPLLPFRHIESIELIIFNRWGQEIFKTTDPLINWDGVNQNSGRVVSEGVYYYTVKVFSNRLAGLEETNLKGSFHVYTN